MLFPEYFSIPFIQAVNDWLVHPTEENARRLAKLSESLPDVFKTRSKHVFRRVDLNKKSVWDLFADKRLGEKISSWTENINVACSHRGIPEGLQAALFRIPPGRGTTIVNISRLFGPGGFRVACTMQEMEISNYDYGIGAFDNSEEEVLVEVSHLHFEDLIGLMEKSSSEVDLVYRAGKEKYGRMAYADEQRALLARMRWSGRKPGWNWLSEEGVSRVLQGIAKKIEVLKQAKRARSL